MLQDQTDVIAYSIQFLYYYINISGAMGMHINNIKPYSSKVICENYCFQMRHRALGKSLF